MKKISNFLAVELPQQWQKRGSVAKLLYPFSLLYGLVVNIRQCCYQFFRNKSIIKKSHSEHDFPVIVVGNPTVGGVGKTPVVIWLVNKLQRMGYQPAVITRGYKGNSPYWPLSVTEDTDVSMCGDEPLMMFLRLNTGSQKCPVIAAPKRVQSLHYIQHNFPETDIVISDDGLQHYAMPRQLEFLILDAKRALGNEWFLPAGPMRESKKTFEQRLEKGAILIKNSANSKVVMSQMSDNHSSQDNDVTSASTKSYYTMNYAGSFVQRVNKRNNKLRLKKIRTSIRVNAVAAIGDPQRFFDYLTNLGFHCIETRAFPDHYTFQTNDLEFDNNYLVIMTEKDAVKCINIANNKCWFIPITAVFDHPFEENMEEVLSSLVSQAKLPPQLLPDPAVQPKQ